MLNRDQGESRMKLESSFEIPIPAWAVIHGSLRYKITPQMFSMQRIYEKTLVNTQSTDFGEVADIVSHIKGAIKPTMTPCTQPNRVGSGGGPSSSSSSELSPSLSFGPPVVSSYKGGLESSWLEKPSQTFSTVAKIFKISTNFLGEFLV